MQQWTCLCGKGPGALQGNETEKGDAQTQAFLGQVNLSSDLSRIWDSHYSVLPPQGQTICSHTLGSEQVQRSLAKQFALDKCRQNFKPEN